MARRNRPDVEIHDNNYGAIVPLRQSVQRRSQGINGDLSAAFQDLDLGERKGKAKDRKVWVRLERGRPVMVRSARPSKYNYECYRFEIRGDDDWSRASRILLEVPQESLKRAAKSKSTKSVTESMAAMNHHRRNQIHRLLAERNDAEWNQNGDGEPVLIQTRRMASNLVLDF